MDLQPSLLRLPLTVIVSIPKDSVVRCGTDVQDDQSP